jgi:hypothetical protein
LFKSHRRSSKPYGEKVVMTLDSLNQFIKDRPKYKLVVS